LCNVSASTFAGSIIGALFLRRFVAPAQDWLHVDLYAWNGKERPGRPVGAEPQAVRALYAWIAERYAPGRGARRGPDGPVVRAARMDAGVPVPGGHRGRNRGGDGAGAL